MPKQHESKKHEKTNLKVKALVPFQSWEDAQCVRVDLKDEKGPGVVLHLYVPQGHPLATLALGAKVKIVNR